MVLAVEKRVTSPLIIPSSIEKIYEIDSKIGKNLLDTGKIIDCGELFFQATVLYPSLKCFRY